MLQTIRKGFTSAVIAFLLLRHRKEMPMCKRTKAPGSPVMTVGVLFGFLLLIVFSPSAAEPATPYPTKAIRLIAPFDAGGTSDLVARVFAGELSKALGKQLYVENRTGAGGTIGASVAANATPDGYTLLLTSSAHPISYFIYKKLPYDYKSAFLPIAKVGSGASSLVAYPGFGANSVKELIAMAKEKPGQLFYSTAGVGGFQHMGMELFKLMAGIDMVAVHFKGGGAAIIDTMGGHSQVQFASLISHLPHIRSGKLKALGTGGAKRTSLLPDVPTIAEAGVPGYDMNNWWGVFAPAGTPAPIIEVLDKACAKALNSPEAKQQFLAQGVEVDHIGPAEFGTFVEAETVKYEKVVKQAGIVAQ
jgi:tripartite-type tricarboxylate transporter receptor subunit TctC